MNSVNWSASSLWCELSAPITGSQIETCHFLCRCLGERLVSRQNKGTGDKGGVMATVELSVMEFPFVELIRGWSIM